MELLAQYPWDVDEAWAVIHGTPNCPNGESGGDPLAYNAGNYSLFQINYASHVGKLIEVTGSSDPNLLFDPAVNVAVAWLVYERSGGGTWLPWSCRPA